MNKSCCSSTESANSCNEVTEYCSDRLEWLTFLDLFLSIGMTIAIRGLSILPASPLSAVPPRPRYSQLTIEERGIIRRMKGRQSVAAMARTVAYVVEIALRGLQLEASLAALSLNRRPRKRLG